MPSVTYSLSHLVRGTLDERSKLITSRTFSGEASKEEESIFIDANKSTSLYPYNGLE